MICRKFQTNARPFMHEEFILTGIGVLVLLLSAFLTWPVPKWILTSVTIRAFLLSLIAILSNIRSLSLQKGAIIVLCSTSVIVLMDHFFPPSGSVHVRYTADRLIQEDINRQIQSDLAKLKENDVREKF